MKHLFNHKRAYRLLETHMSTRSMVAKLTMAVHQKSDLFLDWSFTIPLLTAYIPSRSGHWDALYSHTGISAQIYTVSR